MQLQAAQPGAPRQGLVRWAEAAGRAGQAGRPGGGRGRSGATSGAPGPPPLRPRLSLEYSSGPAHLPFFSFSFFHPIQAATAAAVVRGEGPLALFSGLGPALARGVFYGGKGWGQGKGTGGGGVWRPAAGANCMCCWGRPREGGCLLAPAARAVGARCTGVSGRAKE